MAVVRIKEIEEAFGLLYSALSDPFFRKTSRFRDWSEREFLTPIRFYLLGWFGEVRPEAMARMTKETSGRIDFVVGETAVELAVQRGGNKGTNLSYKYNQTEIIKLLKHNGPSVLVLFDFCKVPTMDNEKLKKFREARIPGKGNHKATTFTVLYYHLDSRRVCPEKLLIRPRQRAVTRGVCATAPGCDTSETRG